MRKLQGKVKLSDTENYQSGARICD